MSSPIDFRQLIDDRLKKDGLSRYQLVQRLQGQVPARTIYDFLSGRHDINSQALALMLDAMYFSVNKHYADLRKKWMEIETQKQITTK